MPDRNLQAEVLAGLAKAEVLAAAAGLLLELSATALTAEDLGAALADVEASAEHLRALLARLPAEHGPEVNGAGDDAT